MLQSDSGHPSSPPVVNTVHGKVLGKYVSLEGFSQPVTVFLGVPFARPPLGSLRFAPPQPAEPWSFVKNATSYPPMCSQDAVKGQSANDLLTNRKEKIHLQFSEDCQYLNSYTPADLTRSSRLPVLSPLAKNLFHRAISESGMVFTSGVYMENTTALTENFSKLDFQGDTKKKYPFTSTVLDGVVLPKAPEEILAKKNVNTVPFLVGINKQEFG
ncbi:hypothetical protein STEG23_035467 [Scotinomys teguina]